ncbi:17829_t:CDS:1, partial [Gigaspora rosea]
KTTILEKDRNIVKFLDTEDLSLITILYNIIELYNWAKHKAVRKETISKEEEYFIGLRELTKPIAFTKNEVDNHKTKIKKEIEIIENDSFYRRY